MKKDGVQLLEIPSTTVEKLVFSMDASGELSYCVVNNPSDKCADKFPQISSKKKININS